MISLAMLVLDPPLERMALLLEYVRPVVGQVVVVVDDRTSREAVETMQAWGTELVPFEWCDDFSAARNAALPFLKGDWTLHLDPDELPSHALLTFLSAVDRSEWGDHRWQGHLYPDPRGYLIWTVNYVDGVKGEEWQEHWHCRLFRTEHGRWYRNVHELVALDGYPEDDTRGSVALPYAPRSALLIHSKTSAGVPAASELYGKIGAPV
jgi:hypothetical protein